MTILFKVIVKVVVTNSFMRSSYSCSSSIFFLTNTLKSVPLLSVMLSTNKFCASQNHSLFNQCPLIFPSGSNIIVTFLSQIFPQAKEPILTLIYYDLYFELLISPRNFNYSSHFHYHTKKSQVIDTHCSNYSSAEPEFHQHQSQHSILCLTKHTIIPSLMSNQCHYCKPFLNQINQYSI